MGEPARGARPRGEQRPVVSRSGTPELDAPLWFPDRTGADAGAEPSTLAKVDQSRLLRPEDYLRESRQPPILGWQRIAWRLGARGVRPGARERRHRRWARLSRRPLAAPKVIAVFSPKGGVGKSTTALQLGQVLARLRGDLIAALDANPDSGNLIKRVAEPYSPGSASELRCYSEHVQRYADLMPYVTEAEGGLCVVRSDTAAAGRLGPVEYREVLGVLSRFYSIIVVDLGTGMREAAFLSIVEAADAVVAVTRPSFDAAEVLVEGMDWLARRFPLKVATSTVVVNASHTVAGELDLDRLEAELSRQVAHVLRVPHDRHLAAGGVPQWLLLSHHTQDAYLKLAATVVDSLPEG
ncbi:MinD/ParA family protein [Fodinicola feengrottensis]|uniref:MinD/ParA family protein n=1 Tax=Fodinicola feengrottensis TaxID=435914 RepID=A0ABN2G0L9_9ACTN